MPRNLHIKIKTPYGIKNWGYIKRLMDNEAETIKVLNEVMAYSHGDDLIDLHDQVYYLIKRMET